MVKFTDLEEGGGFYKMPEPLPKLQWKHSNGDLLGVDYKKIDSQSDFPSDEKRIVAIDSRYKVTPGAVFKVVPLLPGHKDPTHKLIKYKGESRVFSIIPGMFPQGAEFEEVEEDPSNVGGRRRRKTKKMTRKSRKTRRR